MSASLVELDVGGIRGLHWHTEAEWAYVLSGTCRQALHIPACPLLSLQAGTAPILALLTQAAHSMVRLRPIAVIRVHTHALLTPTQKAQRQQQATGSHR